MAYVELGMGSCQTFKEASCKCLLSGLSVDGTCRRCCSDLCRWDRLVAVRRFEIPDRCANAGAFLMATWIAELPVPESSQHSWSDINTLMRRLERKLPPWARLVRMSPDRPLCEQCSNTDVLIPTTGACAGARVG
eukprot:21216-Chlamydomonas_euryale.AAC.6